MKVILEIYKTSGKYYTEGETEVPDGTPLYQIWAIIHDLRNRGKLPGLHETNHPEGHTEFLVRVDVPKHEHRHPRIII